jgi:large subunit ribosomal protein L25
MSKTEINLEVDLRQRTGKGGAREARRQGFVPGVLYGGKLGPVAINLKRNEVDKALNSGSFLSHMVTITHKGKPQKVIPQDVQFHPVSDHPLHIDLYRVKEDQEIKVEVAVHFVGEEKSPGLKKGGTLNVVRYTVELLVPAGDIPEKIVVDLTGLKLNDTVTISKVELPKGARPTIERDFVIANITAPSGLAAAEDEEAADQEAEEAPEGEEEAEGEEA